MSASERVVIVWRSRLTGLCGRGTEPLSRAAGEEWVRDLNIKFPDLSHWLESAAPDGAS